MHKIFVIARREYKAAVQTRAFLISLVVLPILIGGSGLLQWLIKDQVDTAEKKFAVIDRTPHEQLAAVLVIAGDAWNKSRLDDAGKATRPAFVVEKVAPSADRPEDVAQQRFELSEKVRKGTLFAFVEIGARVLEPPPSVPGQPIALASKMRDTENPFSTKSSTTDDRLAVRYQSNSPTYDAFRNCAGPVINLAIREARYSAEGLPADKIRVAVATGSANEQRANPPQCGHGTARRGPRRKSNHFVTCARRIAVPDVHAHSDWLNAAHAGSG